LFILFIFVLFSSWKVLLPHPKAVAAAAAAQTSALCTGADDILEPYEFKEFLYQGSCDPRSSYRPNAE
jgi:hypothetical protein